VARPAATQHDFRGAFVVVSAAPATQEQLDKAASWARGFANVQTRIGLLSFATAAQGRATMSTRLK